MPTVRSAPRAEVRRRPKDRKQQIVRAAAEAFSNRGYHAVGMDDIAAQLGISATALYRHYANKYDLFRAAVLALGEQLVEATEPATEPAEDAGAELTRILDALAATAIANRNSGGLYRWEGRYLKGDDQAALMDQIRLVNRRIQEPLTALRPNLTSLERWMLSSAALSVIGSVADHRVKLAAAQLRPFLVQLGAAVLAADLPRAPRRGRAAKAQPVAPVPSLGRYEDLLQQSLLLFDRQGYHETSMGEIAAAVGIPTSGIYRYFPGKQDILSAVFRRAADRVSGELSSVVAGVTDPAEVLQRLVAAYVASSFANPELAQVYYTEQVNLPENDRQLLRNVQRATVDSWVRLLTTVRPELSEVQARLAVHASMALVIDLGRLVAYDDSVHAQAMVRRLMLVTLGV